MEDNRCTIEWASFKTPQSWSKLFETLPIYRRDFANKSGALQLPKEDHLDWFDERWWLMDATSCVSNLNYLDCYWSYLEVVYSSNGLCWCICDIKILKKDCSQFIWLNIAPTLDHGCNVACIKFEISWLTSKSLKYPSFAEHTSLMCLKHLYCLERIAILSYSLCEGENWNILECEMMTLNSWCPRNEMCVKELMHMNTSFLKYKIIIILISLLLLRNFKKSLSNHISATLRTLLSLCPIVSMPHVNNIYSQLNKW